MTETVLDPSAPAAPPDFRPASENPAVANCCDVWEFTRNQALNEGHTNVHARVAAHKAFQKALPPLIGVENIQNFIACVGHGMLIGAILGSDGARLLYAAQVALDAAGRRTTQQKTAGQ